MQQEEELNRKLNKVKKHDVDEKNENKPFGNIFMNMSQGELLEVDSISFQSS